jgi:hypothetical protein
MGARNALDGNLGNISSKKAVVIKKYGGIF